MSIGSVEFALGAHFWDRYPNCWVQERREVVFLFVCTVFNYKSNVLNRGPELN